MDGSEAGAGLAVGSWLLGLGDVYMKIHEAVSYYMVKYLHNKQFLKRNNLIRNTYVIAQP